MKYFVLLIILLGACTNFQIEKSVSGLIEAENCEAIGGKLQWINSESGTYCHTPDMDKKFSDSGQECGSSDNCEGKCIITKLSQIGKTGFCQETKILPRCYGLVENDYIECTTDDMIDHCSIDNYKYCPEEVVDITTLT